MLWRLFFRSYTSFFLKNTWIFCVFLSVPYLVDNYAKIVDERGRNLMCDRTLPSRLVDAELSVYWFCYSDKVTAKKQPLADNFIATFDKSPIFLCDLVSNVILFDKYSLLVKSDTVYKTVVSCPKKCPKMRNFLKNLLLFSWRCTSIRIVNSNLNLSFSFIKVAIFLPKNS